MTDDELLMMDAMELRKKYPQFTLEQVIQMLGSTNDSFFREGDGLMQSIMNRKEQTAKDLRGFKPRTLPGSIPQLQNNAPSFDLDWWRRTDPKRKVWM